MTLEDFLKHSEGLDMMSALEEEERIKSEESLRGKK